MKSIEIIQIFNSGTSSFEFGTSSLCFGTFIILNVPKYLKYDTDSPLFQIWYKHDKHKKFTKKFWALKNKTIFYNSVPNVLNVPKSQKLSIKAQNGPISHIILVQTLVQTTIIKCTKIIWASNIQLMRNMYYPIALRKNELFSIFFNFFQKLVYFFQKTCYNIFVQLIIQN